MIAAIPGTAVNDRSDAETRPVTAQVIEFIDIQKKSFGVEPICTELQIASSTYYAAKGDISARQAVPCSSVVMMGIMSVRIDDPARLGESELPDGRLLGWAEWGPSDGFPVLLCPGAATSRWLGLGADAVAALRIRLVSVDRPGLGASTPAPGRRFGDFADVSPVELRGLVDKISSNPAGAEEIFTGFTADAMWSMVTGGSTEADLAVYQDAVFEAAYRQALNEGFAQGPAGYARDTVLAMGRWPFNLAMINVPVNIWYGEQDSGHSPDNGAMLAARIPGARRHVVPGIGGAVLWTHAKPILRFLLE